MAESVLSQHVQITMPDFSTISQPSQIDPDVSSTLTDFLAYTEHLPSAVTRSMTLIGEQDRIASDMQQRVHDMLSTYSRLPTFDGDAPDATTLRLEISRLYQQLEKARRMAQAESVRMLDMVRKDKTRLEVITRKLRAMPLPPSRDPTPEPVSSPQMRKAQPVSEKRAAHRTGSAPRVRGRKIMVPGEVLPPPNPDSPPMSDASDDDLGRMSPTPDRKPPKSVGRSRTPKPPKERKEKKDKTPRPPRVRTPGHPGTNVHSSIAGISTSNALLKLIEPPADAVPGSKWLPWKRITEFELAKLRKRMKKNAIWLPSPAMRNRELKLLGRGQQAMEVARQAADEGGPSFVDEYGPDWRDPTSTAPMNAAPPSPIPSTAGPDLDATAADEALMNRGMRLNEAKKRKRERLAEERQAEEAAIAAQLAHETRSATPRPVPSPSPPKKRKREPSPAAPGPAAAAVHSSPPEAPAKKRKLSLPAQPPTRRVSRSPLPQPAAAAPPEQPKPRITLKRSKAASAEPPAHRRSLRRGSNASLPGRAGSVDSRPPEPPRATGGAGRKKRPLPGLITADEDGRAKVSVGKRRTAPRKEREREEVEVLDPDEPRYCTCGDVSWGTMIACDSEECEKEWFHLSCVELDDMPPRRTRWYCPDCRRKLKKGMGTNGIVRA